MKNSSTDKPLSIRDRSYRFSLELIDFLSKTNRSQASVIIINQCLRSGTSIGANVSESRGTSSRLEFKRFHEIALRSANETVYWLELLRDSTQNSEAELLSLIDSAKQLRSILGATIIKLKS